LGEIVGAGTTEEVKKGGQGDKKGRNSHEHQDAESLRKKLNKGVVNIKNRKDSSGHKLSRTEFRGWDKDNRNSSLGGGQESRRDRRG